jgi:glucuronyl/N-acetylglucosaminyl transferase EXT2
MKMMRRANHTAAAQVLPLQTTTSQQQKSQAQHGSPRARKQQSRTASRCPTKSSFSPFLQKQGSTYLHPGIVAAYGIFTVTVLFAVHIYLFTLANGRITSEQPHPVGSAVHTTIRASSEKPAVRNAITPLRPLDREQYTIRINTWKRTEQLRISLNHHASCESVKQIQVVWCTAQGEPPEWLASAPKVVVEYHEVNSLSERFRILLEPPTAGILTIDDDVLRPCIAIDAGFFKWIDNPDRMVGFDARGHGIVKAADTAASDKSLVGPDQTQQQKQDEHWSYSYLSTTEKTNQYSLTLPRYAFVHRDYLDSYFTAMPAVIRETVATNFNCEDIAMSFWVSSQTDGRPPLLADWWAIKSQIKLYSAKAISSTKNHKSVRDACVEDFAEALQLKSRLSLARYVHTDDHEGLFECGAPANKPAKHMVPSKIQVELHEKVQKWRKQGKDALFQDVGQLRQETSMEAFEQGFLEGSQPWKGRFRATPS